MENGQFFSSSSSMTSLKRHLSVIQRLFFFLLLFLYLCVDVFFLCVQLKLRVDKFKRRKGNIVLWPVLQCVAHIAAVYKFLAIGFDGAAMNHWSTRHTHTQRTTVMDRRYENGRGLQFIQQQSVSSLSFMVFEDCHKSRQSGHRQLPHPSIHLSIDVCSLKRITM